MRDDFVLGVKYRNRAFMLFLHRPNSRSAISPRIISGIVKPFGLNCARPNVLINPLLRRYRRLSAFAVTELNFTEGERTVPVEVIFLTDGFHHHVRSVRPDEPGVRLDLVLKLLLMGKSPVSRLLQQSLHRVWV